MTPKERAVIEAVSSVNLTALLRAMQEAKSWDPSERKDVLACVDAIDALRESRKPALKWRIDGMYTVYGPGGIVFPVGGRCPDAAGARRVCHLLNLADPPDAV